MNFTAMSKIMQMMTICICLSVKSSKYIEQVNMKQEKKSRKITSQIKNLIDLYKK